ncbi:MFS transporter [Brevibacillus sp. SYP-B805]|uniref:MFS transporter n=1 Tax=Brevibacillus sp. SYP-B805 TaxID=1578199 RepID=UPI0013EDB579|nr:MFS transporter [Brevibacillus sp. SYP-B805]NGQ97384.1 MFS transporter [Brevibacillus sp. SYP-B805]
MACAGLRHPGGGSGGERRLTGRVPGVEHSDAWLMRMMAAWRNGNTPYRPSLPLIFLFISLIAFLDGWAGPAQDGLVPRLVGPGHLLKANGLVSMAVQSVQLIGWASGGLLVSALGSGRVLWLTLFLYVIATCLMGAIRPVEVHPPKQQSARTARSTRQEEWRILLHHPALRVIAVMDVLDGLAGAVWIGAILLVYVKQVLGQGDEWWGFINASYLIGTIAGGVLVVSLGILESLISLKR